jgi:hypothetical protein
MQRHVAAPFPLPRSVFPFPSSPSFLPGKLPGKTPEHFFRTYPFKEPAKGVFIRYPVGQFQKPPKPLLPFQVSSYGYLRHFLLKFLFIGSFPFFLYLKVNAVALTGLIAFF